MGVAGGRWVRRALGALAVGGALAMTGAAQNTTVTATALKMGGRLVTIGQVGFLPVDATGKSVPFSSGGLNAPLAYACNVVNGAIGQPCVVPDSTLTNPANVCYSVQIAGTAPGFSGRQIYTLPQVCISGTSWALDAYVPPAQTTNMQPLQQSSGAAAPSGSCNTSAVYEQLGTANAWWFCNAGSWVQASGGGGVPVTASAVQSALAGQSGCSTTGNLYDPASNTCTARARTATVSHVFSGAGTFNYAHNLGTLYPLMTCYVNSGSTSFAASNVDANSTAITVTAAADITCTFGK